MSGTSAVLPGGGDDTSIGLWVMAYDIKYMDDRRLGAYTEDANCPDNFIGEHIQQSVVSCCLIARTCASLLCV